MAFAGSHSASSLTTASRTSGSLLTAVIGKASELIAAHRKRKALAILEALPMDVRKDIGWQTGN